MVSNCIQNRMVTFNPYNEDQPRFLFQREQELIKGIFGEAYGPFSDPTSDQEIVAYCQHKISTAFDEQRKAEVKNLRVFKKELKLAFKEIESLIAKIIFLEEKEQIQPIYPSLIKQKSKLSLKEIEKDSDKGQAWLHVLRDMRRKDKIEQADELYENELASEIAKKLITIDEQKIASFIKISHQCKEKWQNNLCYLDWQQLALDTLDHLKIEEDNYQKIKAQLNSSKNTWLSHKSITEIVDLPVNCPLNSYPLAILSLSRIVAAILIVKETIFPLNLETIEIKETLPLINERLTHYFDLKKTKLKNLRAQQISLGIHHPEHFYKTALLLEIAKMLTTPQGKINKGMIDPICQIFLREELDQELLQTEDTKWYQYVVNILTYLNRDEYFCRQIEHSFTFLVPYKALEDRIRIMLDLAPSTLLKPYHFTVVLINSLLASLHQKFFIPILEGATTKEFYAIFSVQLVTHLRKWIEDSQLTLDNSITDHSDLNKRINCTSKGKIENGGYLWESPGYLAACRQLEIKNPAEMIQQSIAIFSLEQKESLESSISWLALLKHLAKYSKRKEKLEYLESLAFHAFKAKTQVLLINIYLESITRLILANPETDQTEIESLYIQQLNLFLSKTEEKSLNEKKPIQLLEETVLKLRCLKKEKRSKEINDLVLSSWIESSKPIENIVITKMLHPCQQILLTSLTKERVEKLKALGKRLYFKELAFFFKEKANELDDKRYSTLQSYAQMVFRTLMNVNLYKDPLGEEALFLKFKNGILHEVLTKEELSSYAKTLFIMPRETWPIKYRESKNSCGLTIDPINNCITWFEVNPEKTSLLAI